MHVVRSNGRMELWLHLLAVLGCSDWPAEGVGIKELVFTTCSILICICLKTLGDRFIWLLMIANDKADTQEWFRFFCWTPPLPGTETVPYLFSFHFPPGGGNWERRGALGTKEICGSSGWESGQSKALVPQGFCCVARSGSWGFCCPSCPALAQPIYHWLQLSSLISEIVILCLPGLGCGLIAWCSESTLKKERLPEPFLLISSLRTRPYLEVGREGRQVSWLRRPLPQKTLQTAYHLNWVWSRDGYVGVWVCLLVMVASVK